MKLCASDDPQEEFRKPWHPAVRFWACVWGLDCIIELSRDSAGQPLIGFEADGEALEVTMNAVTVPSEFSGVLRGRGLEDSFASFRARPDLSGLWLEMDISEGEDAETQRAVFFRLPPQ